MVFAGDSSIHSTKFGGLPRPFPLLFDMVLNHAFRMIFAEDSSIHSTKFGGLLRLLPLLFDMDALDI